MNPLTEVNGLAVTSIEPIEIPQKTTFKHWKLVRVVTLENDTHEYMCQQCENEGQRYLTNNKFNMPQHFKRHASKSVGRKAASTSVAKRTPPTPAAQAVSEPVTAVKGDPTIDDVTEMFIKMVAAIGHIKLSEVLQMLETYDEWKVRALKAEMTLEQIRESLTPVSQG